MNIDTILRKTLFISGLALIDKTLPAILEMINKDTDRSGVMAAVDSLNEILKSLKVMGLKNQEYIQSIATVINDILMEKVSSFILCCFN